MIGTTGIACCHHRLLHYVSKQSRTARRLHASLTAFNQITSPPGMSEVKRQNALFDEEKRRQSSLVPRLEKIRVTVQGIKSNQGKDIVLLMNKGVSTPYDCAMHIHELYSKQPIALIDSNTLWDLHRPLEKDCTLAFQNFLQDNPSAVNRVFWRSCSFVLGLVIETAFKAEQDVKLHSWPIHFPSSSSFVYDVHLPKLTSWNPTRNELLALTSVLWKVKGKGLEFERLSIPMTLAQDLFSGNQFKVAQLRSMDKDDVTVYRIGDHVDISVGPMVCNTNQIGRSAVTAVHPVKSSDGVPLFRFQGVAIPDTLRLNQFAFNILLEKSKVFNPTNCI